MIVVTGAAGFIGSCMVGFLNHNNYKDIILVDDFFKVNKLKNIENKFFTEKVQRNDFFEWLKENEKFVQIVIHLGARTDTTEFNVDIFNELNLEYSKKVWSNCIQYGIPLIYASSAATYGMGELGFDDNHDVIDNLKPLNPYGNSKNDFDKWALSQKKSPYYWAGLKFFNVYGPNEYHKGRMASVVYHAFNQIKDTGKVTLFKSHNPDYKDGEQKRDFIYVKDLVDVIHFLMNLRKHSGIYNLGTGKASTFNELVRALFKSMNLPEQINYIDTPIDIRDKYQYFTEAKMNKLNSIGYSKLFANIENGISDYVNYLTKSLYI